MAQLLGLWLADGDAASAVVVQGSLPAGHPHCHHELFAFLMEDYGGEN